ncbi:hypothetical protein GCM10027447_07460 [Glycomyces halotolerans]
MHVHLAFATGHQRSVFDEAVLDQCERVMRKVCEDFRWGAFHPRPEGRCFHSKDR